LLKQIVSLPSPDGGLPSDLRIEAAQPGKTRGPAGSVPELADILGFAEILSLEL